MKNILIIMVLTIAFTGSAIYVKTKNSSTAPFSHKISVVTSFYPLYFFAEMIGGEKVNVTNITPAGAEPHDYEPTTTDIRVISESDLLILNGVGLESWGTKVESKRVLTVTDSIETTDLTKDTQKIIDPHVWLSPILAAQIATNITKELISISPQDHEFFEANNKKLVSELMQLDEAFIKGLSDCTKRDIVTSHAAFGYLAHQYKFNQIALSGVSPDEEPTPQKLSEISKLIRQKDINYIFFESLVSPRLAETIAHETNTQTLVFNPLEGLTPNEIQSGANYFSVQRENLKNLRTALSCM